MRLIKADLHVHTCLSPCAGAMMVPTRIARAAFDRQVEMIAVCDHNATGNVDSVAEAAGEFGITVIGGVEICTREEVHILGWFPPDTDLEAVQRELFDVLSGTNSPDMFGRQWLVDGRDDILGECPNLLIAAVDLELGGAVDLLRRYGGLAVAAHIDRPSYSVFSQLGFFPNRPRFDAVEVHGVSPAGIPDGLPTVRDSDAHEPEKLGERFTLLRIERPSFEELAMALAGRKGREIV